MKEHTQVALPQENTRREDTKVAMEAAKVAMEAAMEAMSKAESGEDLARGTVRPRSSRRGGTAGTMAAWLGVAVMSSLGAMACRSGGPDSSAGRGGRGGNLGVTATGQGGGVILSRGSSDAGTPPAQVDVARLLGGDGSNGGSGGVGGSTPLAGGGAGSGGADAGVDLGGAPTQNGCAPPFESNVCDPVCNTGCPALSRCNVTGEPRTGKCIGIWISGEGDLCLKTSITDPCASRLTCVDGSCRRLCYRDADCASPGSCCDQDLFLEGQVSGYKICVACPR